MARTKGIGECPWCKYNPHGCDNDTCDFKTLPFTKIDTLNRLKKEATRVGELRDEITNSKNINALSEKKMGELVDLIKAMEIMSKVLTQEFKVSEEELKKELGVDVKKKMSWGQKAKLMAKVALMKKTRGKKV